MKGISKGESHFKTGMGCLKKVLGKLEKSRESSDFDISEDTIIFLMSYLKMAESEFNKMWLLVSRRSESFDESHYGKKRHTSSSSTKKNIYINLNEISKRSVFLSEQRKVKARSRRQFTELTTKSDELSSSFLSPKDKKSHHIDRNVKSIPRFDIARENDSKFYKKLSSKKSKKAARKTSIQSITEYLNSQTSKNPVAMWTGGQKSKIKASSPKINISEHLKTKKGKSQNSRLFSELNILGENQILKDLSSLCNGRNLISKKIKIGSSPKLKMGRFQINSPSSKKYLDKENNMNLANMTRKYFSTLGKMRQKKASKSSPKNSSKTGRNNVISLNKVLKQIGSKRKEDILKRQKSIELLEKKLKKSNVDTLDLEDRVNNDLTYSKESKCQSFYENELKKFMKYKPRMKKRIEANTPKKTKKSTRRSEQSKSSNQHDILTFRNIQKNVKKSRDYLLSCKSMNGDHRIGKSSKDEEFKAILGRFTSHGINARSKSVSLNGGIKISRMKEIARLESEISKMGGFYKFK